MTRNAYLLPEHNLILFWAPKAACTSIADVVFNDLIEPETVCRLPTGGGRRKKLVNAILYRFEKAMNIPVTNRLSFRKNHRRWLRKNGYELTGLAAAELAARREMTTIGMIRDPYERLVSAFLDKFVTHPERDLTRLNGLEGFSRNLFLAWREEKGLRKDTHYKGFSFYDFVTYICDKIDDPSVAETDIDHHWNTQIPHAFFSKGFQFDYLFNVTQSKAYFRTLGEITGTQVSSRHLNRSCVVEEAAVAPKSVVHVPSVALSGHAKIEKTALENQELRDRVNHSFAIDKAYLTRAGT